MANPAFCKIFGCKNEEEVKDFAPANLYQNSKERKEYSDNLIQKGVFKNDERALLKRDGTPVHTSITAKVVYGKDGEVSHFDSIMLDITEQKLAEDALRESEDFNSSLLNNSPNPILVINPDTSLRYVNPALQNLTGFSSSELIGRKAPYPWWTEETLQKTSKDLQKAMRTGARKLEEHFKKKNGEQFWVEITSEPVKKNGEFVHYLANWVDLTARKQGEEALQESEEKYRSLVNNMDLGITLIDCAHNIIMANTALERLYNKPVDEVVGKKCFREFEKRDGVCPHCAGVRAMATGNTEEVETEGVKDDGTRMTVRIQAFPTFSPDGATTGFIEVVEDITEKRRLQAEAMRAGHLASLGELAAGVAHEINNPISGIISYAEILKDEFNDRGEDADIPTRIIKEGDRVAEIVKNLLAFARDRKEEHSPAYIQDTLADAFALVERQIIKDGIKFNVDVSPDLPGINARSQEIQQVFLNIISNARYALNQRFPGSHEDKVFEIRGETLEIKGKQHVRIIFYYRGTGISEDILDRICNPFYSTKPKNEGTGLGLSISHAIIKDHRGKLWFDSIEGQYTKVMVALPVD